jgi:hypothetical protein
MKTSSIWEKRSFLTSTDYLVVGAGITGISTAYHLKKKHPDAAVKVIERSPFPGGASTKNAGFACIGSPSELLDDLKTSTSDEVFSLVERRWKGLQMLITLLGEDNICYEHLPAHELFLERDILLYQECLEHLESFNNNLQQITGLERSFFVVPPGKQSWTFDGFSRAFCCAAEGQIDTGEMMRSWLDLARSVGVKFLFGLEAIEIGKNQLQTEFGPIKFGQLLICTNGLTKKLMPELEIEPARAQVLLTTPIENLGFRGPFHYDRGYFYFRNLEDRVLFGGGRHLDIKGETTTTEETSDLIQQTLEEHLRKHILPGCKFKIEHRWAGIMGVGQKKQPILKQLDERILFAVRLGGMGVALGSLLGKELSEMAN